MIGLYFSGSGNSKKACEYLLHQIDPQGVCYPIEDDDAVINAIKNTEEFIFAYPIYYSTLPKIVSDFIEEHASLWSGKRIFLLASMNLFSGDGCGCGKRQLQCHGAIILGGKHVYLPDCICDEKILKATKQKRLAKIEKTKKRLNQVAIAYHQQRYPKQGLSKLSCFAGWISQRLWFHKKTQTYHDLPNVDDTKCIACEACVNACPMGNLYMKNGKVEHFNACTLCYRCANICPKQAITLLGKRVYVQNHPNEDWK